MVGELQNADLVDPLHGYSVLSLLPRTFRDLKKTADSEQDDMQSMQRYLKSLAFKSPNKLLEQAKTILNSSSEVHNPELPHHVPSEDKDIPAPAKGKDRPQERRPALGRKRARFSLKPNTSQPSWNEDMSLNIGQFQDPEEFFLAYEKLENAKKELQKQRGDTSTDSTQHNLSTMARHRRPGILGYDRKTVGYKHRYSSVLADRGEALVSSQEIFEVDIPGSCNNSLSPETIDHGTLEEGDLAGDGCVDIIQEKDSVAEAENRVNSLLDEFLSTSCTNLDADGTLNFLQERLQIKPINLDKLSLPDLDSLRRSDVKASAEQLPRPRKALSDIHNAMERVNNKTSVEKDQHLAQSFIYQRVSPTPPKSPFSSMSLLKRRISQIDPPGNPFSFHVIDISPARHSSPVEGIDKQALSPHVDANHVDANDPAPAEVDAKGLNFSGKFQSLMVEENNTATSNMNSRKLVTEDLARPFDRPMDNNSNTFNTEMNIGSNGSDGGLEDKVEDMQQEAVASEQPELGLEGLAIGTPQCGGSQLDQSDPTAGEHRTMGGNLEIADMLPEQNNETHQEPSRISLNDQSEQKAPQRNRSKRKVLSHRQSLAGAGTVWQSGVRRSTRIRMRPLEYWRGERFLYGRIHDSLLTVIGIKYESPAKGDGKPTFKVKSYVSEEYEELVNQAALH